MDRFFKRLWAADETRNALGLISKLLVIVAVQDLKISFHKQILVPPPPLSASASLLRLLWRRLCTNGITIVIFREENVQEIFLNVYYLFFLMHNGSKMCFKPCSGVQPKFYQGKSLKQKPIFFCQKKIDVAGGRSV